MPLLNTPSSDITGIKHTMLVESRVGRPNVHIIFYDNETSISQGFALMRKG
jgi:hypothetical protein